MNFKSFLDKLDAIVAEGKKETKTGVVHKAEKGGYGRKVDVNKPEDKKAEPAVKRGRGRPKKDSDSETGEVKKWDTDELSRWIVGSKPKTLPGKASVKHKLKDEEVEEGKTGPGLWANIHAKRERIKGGSGEKMRKPGSKGAPTAANFKSAQAGTKKESVAEGGYIGRITAPTVGQHLILDTSYLDSMYGYGNQTKGVVTRIKPSGKGFWAKVSNGREVNEIEFDMSDIIEQGVAEASDYFRRREREEDIISGKRPARKKAPAQTSDYAKRREQEKKAGQGVAEGKKETKTGVVHKAEKGGYGRKVDVNKPEDKKAEPAVKRGRGRPKKDSDSETGEVKKWDTDELSRWIVGSKPKTLPGKASVKHKLKDWMEHVETTMIVESIVGESDLTEVDAVLKDIANGVLEMSNVMNHPSNEVEQQVSELLQRKCEAMSSDLDSDINQIEQQVLAELQEQYGTSLDETNVTMAPVQSGSQQIKVDDKTIGVATNPQAANTLKQAIEKGDVTFGMDDKLTESKNVDYAEKLADIISDYPFEHKQAQDGWGMHENFYHALCDHYWKEGRIPRNVMYGPAEGLKSYVEECYAEDTMGSMEEGMTGAALGGIAGAALTKTPSGAIAGANLGSNVEDALFDGEIEEDAREIAANKIRTPAVFRKDNPVSLSDIGAEPKFVKKGMDGSSDKYWSIHDEPLARANDAEELPESELERALRGSVEEMENSMFENKKSKTIKKQSKDMQVESWEKELSKMLTEGLTVTTSTGQQGVGDSVSVSATDEHAQTLMKLLQDAGLSGTLSDTASSEPSSVAEPASSDEVMSQLSSDESDDMGDTTLSFIKQMISNRNGSMGDEMTVDSSDEEYSDEETSSADDSEEEEVKEADVEEGNKFTGNLVKARAAGKKEADLDGDGDMEPVREGEQTCNECGEMMEEGHDCHKEEKSEESEELREWANTPHDDVDDKGFKAELDFMTKYISGGLNKIKQDQTVMPNTRAKVDADQSSIAEIIRKLENIK